LGKIINRCPSVAQGYKDADKSGKYFEIQKVRIPLNLHVRDYHLAQRYSSGIIRIINNQLYEQGVIWSVQKCIFAVGKKSKL
jgi:hypothetical protein